MQVMGGRDGVQEGFGLLGMPNVHGTGKLVDDAVMQLAKANKHTKQTNTRAQ
jgi:hypothetical protein